MQNISPVGKSKSLVLKYYDRYEYMADQYAKKIFSSYKISYDYCDLLQEFKMKIYTSIIAYGKRWLKYKQEGRYKPVDIHTYLCSALNNRAKDLIKEITEAPSGLISIEENTFDYSIHTESYNLQDLKEIRFEINGVNLVKGLSRKKAACFVLYAKGFKYNELGKIFKFDPQTVVENHIKNLKKNIDINSIMSNNERTFVNYSINND